MTATKPLPAALRQRLVDAGRLSVDGLGRAAQLRTCRGCGAMVLVGLDSGRAALRVVADPITLDPLGEAMTLLSGRHTFELWGRELEGRDKWKIAGGMRKPVIPEHSCQISTVPSDEILALFLAGQRENESEPPF